MLRSRMGVEGGHRRSENVAMVVLVRAVGGHGNAVLFWKRSKEPIEIIAGTVIHASKCQVLHLQTSRR